MIENEKDLICSKKHSNQTIMAVIMNQLIPVSERLLCGLCITDLDGNLNIISFKKAISIIQQKQQKIQEKLDEQVKQTQQRLESFKQKLDLVKSNIIQQFDSLLKISEQWSNNLNELKNQRKNFNLFMEIENLDESIQFKKERIKYECNQINYSYFQKIDNLFNLEYVLKNIVSIKESIDDLQTESHNEVFLIPQQPVYVYQNFENSTPHLALKCEEHNSEIIHVDLSKGQQKEKRLKCICCIKGGSVNVVQFQKQWEQYSNQRQLRIHKKQTELKKQLDIVKGIPYQFIINLAKHIKETLVWIETNKNIEIINYNQTQFKDRLIYMAEKLSQGNEVEFTNDLFHNEEKNAKIIQESLNKLQMLNSHLNETFNKCQFDERQGIQKTLSEQTQPTSGRKRVSYEIVNQSAKQIQNCKAIAFNSKGKLAAATCDKDIRIWKFEKGLLEPTEINLQGHEKEVYCLVYSKRKNWIASAGWDQTIRLWKEMENNQWSSSEPKKEHKGSILCLLMNGMENQLISGSSDKLIKVWKINYEKNKLKYQDTLEKHLDRVLSISLNESENTLISCGSDKQILIWIQGQDKKWQFKELVNQSVDDYGKRICFLGDKFIAWTQYQTGFIHIFEMENSKFLEKPELKIELKQSGNDGDFLFPAVYLKQTSLMITKHNRYVYIIACQQNGIPDIQYDIIDCKSLQNYGGLTNDGQYLVIWNRDSKEFKVYKLKYD